MTSTTGISQPQAEKPPVPWYWRDSYGDYHEAYAAAQAGQPTEYLRSKPSYWRDKYGPYQPGPKPKALASFYECYRELTGKEDPSPASGSPATPAEAKSELERVVLKAIEETADFEVPSYWRESNGDFYEAVAAVQAGVPNEYFRPVPSYWRDEWGPYGPVPRAETITARFFDNRLDAIAEESVAAEVETSFEGGTSSEVATTSSISQVETLATAKAWLSDHTEAIAGGVLLFAAGFFFVRLMAFLRPSERWSKPVKLAQRVSVWSRRPEKAKRPITGALVQGVVGAVTLSLLLSYSVVAAVLCGVCMIALFPWGRLAASGYDALLEVGRATGTALNRSKQQLDPSGEAIGSEVKG